MNVLRLTKSLCHLSLLVLCSVGMAKAAPGNLDPAFGAGGKTSLAEGGAGSALFSQSNGKLLLLKGSTLLRLQADGALDHSFGSNGRVDTGFMAPRVVVRTDDSIVVVESVCPHYSASPPPRICYNATDVALKILDANASTSVSVLPVNLGFAGPFRRLVAQPDGKIVVAAEESNGFINNTPGATLSLIRLTAAGALDTTFGGGGQVVTILPVAGGAGGMTLQSDGKLLLSNDTQTARFLATGALDTTFGSNGLIAAGSSEMRLQADGKVLLHGAGGLSRYQNNGTLDSTFNGAGYLACTNTCADFVSQSNGKLLTLGSAQNNFVLSRYTATGAIDTTFDGDGVASTDLAGSDYGLALLLQADGRIVASGASLSSAAPYQSLPLARYIGDPAAAGDLAVSVNDGPDPIASNSTLTYTVHVSNLGSTSVSSVTLTDVLPAGVTHLSTTPSQGTCSGTTTIICSLGAMAAGVHATVVISVQTGATAGIQTNDASLSANTNLINNSASATTLVSDFADLEISALDLTPTHNLPVNANGTVSYTIKNMGTVSSAVSNIRFYLSTDALFDAAAADVLLNTAGVAAIAPGGSLGSTAMATIPAGTALGNYQVIAVLDAVASETNTQNNTRLTPVTVVPDVNVSLSGLSINATTLLKDSSYNVSKSVSVTAPVPTPFTLRLFLSADQAFDSTDMVLSDSTINLSAGGSDSSNVPVTIPLGMLSGNYYLGAIADFNNAVIETSEADNQAFTPVSVKSNIDLGMSACTPATLNTAPGGTFMVNTSVNNGGASSADPFRIGVYLSSDAVAGNGNDVLIGQTAVSALVAGASVSSAIPATIPTSTSLGSYTLFCKADHQDALAETNESNNVSAPVPMSVGAPTVDLLLSAMTASKSVMDIGDSINIGDTVWNQGTLSTATASNKPNFILRYYLSTDTTISSTDRLLASRYVRHLSAGASNAATTAMKIPLTLTMTGTSATFYLGVIVDGNGDVAENNEINNSHLGPQITVRRDMDLRFVSQPTGTPASIGIGLGFDLNNSVTNQGTTVTSGAVTVRFYLSRDGLITTTDTLIGSRSIASLAAGASLAALTRVTVPVNVAPGNYTIGAIIDPLNKLPETPLPAAETNNTWTGPLINVFRDMDVTLTDATPLTITDLRPGYNVNVSNTVRNGGSTYTSGSVTVRFYLSLDANVTTADILMGSRTLSPLAPGVSSTAISSAKIPVSLPPGIYYFGAIVDPANLLPETNEANNLKTNGTITVNP